MQSKSVRGKAFVLTATILMSAMCAHAGFMDNLKSIGKSVADVAESAVDVTVGVSTSVVQSVKQESVSHEESINGGVSTKISIGKKSQSRLIHPSQLATQAQSGHLQNEVRNPVVNGEATKSVDVSTREVTIEAQKIELPQEGTVPSVAEKGTEEILVRSEDTEVKPQVLAKGEDGGENGVAQVAGNQIEVSDVADEAAVRYVEVSPSRPASTESVYSSESGKSNYSEGLEQGFAAIVVYGGVIAAFVVIIVLYGCAYSKVKRGLLVCYAGWLDLFGSVAWIFFGVIGYLALFRAGVDGDGKVLGYVFFVIGLVSFAWMIAGAFVYNRGVTFWQKMLSVGSRIIVGVLFIFAIAQLQQKLKEFQEADRNIAAAAKGAIIALAVFAVVYKFLVKPMVGRRNADDDFDE